jgi:deazaflavin-dependent oxidoreductase (nitroreductase family)
LKSSLTTLPLPDMQERTQPIDSPTPWVAEHIKQYVESDGQDGHLWRGVPTLLLTTTGRKTGQRHRSALIYGQDGDSFMVVGSKGGSDKHPLWYLNLVAQPEVEVQVGADKFAARARVAQDDERARLWPIMAAIFPLYTQYQTKTQREIPVVVLERITPP